MDVDDLTGTGAGGLHLATMGGVWQAVTYGSSGCGPQGGALAIDPHLPRRWRQADVRLRFQGQRVRVRVGDDRIAVDCRQALTLRLGS